MDKIDSVRLDALIRARKSRQKMVERCHQKSCDRYQYYGARGIKVCDRWRGQGGFQNFLDDMGLPDPGQTLDRIDVNGDYTPENCRWASAGCQNRNRRDTVRVEYEGRMMPIADLTVKLNLDHKVVMKRYYDYGWIPNKCLAPTRRTYQEYLEAERKRHKTRRNS
jgi:hypothetical protein